MDARIDQPMIAAPVRRGGAASTIWVILGIAAIAAFAWWLVQRSKNAGSNDPSAGPQAGASAQGGRSGGRAGRGGRGGMPNVVSVAKVQLGEAPVIRSALGTVTPLATVTVRPQVNGQIFRIDFQEGDIVQKGEVVAEIDPRPFQLAIDQAKGQLARDQATLANNRLDLQRYTTLLKQDSIAAQQVATQQATVRSAAAVVQADQATLGTAQLNLVYSRIQAPVTGRIGLRAIDVGNYVQTGNTTIATITQLEPIDVVFTLPEDQVAQVSQRMRAGGALPVTIYDRARTNRLAQGKLFTLDNQVDVTTGTLKAKARFDNGDGHLIPNQFVNVDLTVQTLQNVAIAPGAAFRHGTGGDYAYVVGQDRVAHVRYVTLGPQIEDNVAVLKGLGAGELVVTEGGDRLTEGSHVVLPGDRRPGSFGTGQGANGGHHRRGGGSGGQGSSAGGA